MQRDLSIIISRSSMYFMKTAGHCHFLGQAVRFLFSRTHLRVVVN